jgi:arsenate reductase (thioredoxin)
MAEAWLNRLGHGAIEAFSAGSRPAGYVHPLAVQVMAEAGLDISRHRSKPVNDFLGQAFDYVITVCDDAAESCPVFPGQGTRVHWGFEDPARTEGDENLRLHAFRSVRDGLRERIEALVAEMGV